MNRVFCSKFVSAVLRDCNRMAIAGSSATAKLIIAHRKRAHDGQSSVLDKRHHMSIWHLRRRIIRGDTRYIQSKETWLRTSFTIDNFLAADYRRYRSRIHLHIESSKRYRWSPSFLHCTDIRVGDFV